MCPARERWSGDEECSEALAWQTCKGARGIPTFCTFGTLLHLSHALLRTDGLPRADSGRLPLTLTTLQLPARCRGVGDHLGRQLAEKIERAGNRRRPLSRHVGVDHGCLETLVTEQDLDGVQIDAALDEVGCEAMPEGVAMATCSSSRGGCPVGLGACAVARLTDMRPPFGRGCVRQYI
jgi:hypothetical protein